MPTRTLTDPVDVALAVDGDAIRKRLEDLEEQKKSLQVLLRVAHRRECREYKERCAANGGKGELDGVL
jgi:hypothetical protein